MGGGGVEALVLGGRWREVGGGGGRRGFRYWVLTSPSDVSRPGSPQDVGITMNVISYRYQRHLVLIVR